MSKQMCTLLFLILVIPYRLLNLKNTFETKYGESPLFYAYAPGRVNLIGKIYIDIYFFFNFYIIG